MKLAGLSVIAALLVGSAGTSSAQPFDPYAPSPAAAPTSPPPHVGAPLRAAIMARFDRDRDGRLDPRERRRAIRALRQVARQLARQQRLERRGAMRRHALVQRYDLNGDGVVGPGEMPPGVANRMRWRDRDRDGWLDDAELGK
jgi:hypothetical protein